MTARSRRGRTSESNGVSSAGAGAAAATNPQRARWPCVGGLGKRALFLVAPEPRSGCFSSILARKTAGKSRLPSPWLGFARLRAVRHRYPFQALHWLRQQRVDQQAAVLGESAQRAARARSEAALAEAARRSSEQNLLALSAAEQVRLDEGLVRAGDLATVADWHRGAANQLAAKVDRERCAREARAAESAAESAARRALASASSDAKVSAAHRDAFNTQRARAEELSEEEAAAERWTTRHFSARRG